MKRLPIAAALLALLATLYPAPRASTSGDELDLAPTRDPSAACEALDEDWMVHIFDTATMPDGPWYVNDHSLVQAPDGSWHLYGIFNREPMGADNEVRFVHAIAKEPTPSKWTDGSFLPAPPPYTFALAADPGIGESHLWAPHVMKSGARWLMFYNGGGRDDDHASIRLATSEDLYEWARASAAPLFEDYCAARDPMVIERDGVYSMYYTRCESLWHKVSGVALRTSTDLLHWSEPKMALTMGDDTLMPNSGYSESPFVFRRNGVWMLSITEYPRAWDGTYLYRSADPTLFPTTPFAKLRAHAGEWLFEEDRTWLTHAGPGQGGVWLARVKGI